MFPKSGIPLPERESGQKHAGVFLDRDGTICEEVGYLDAPGKVRLIPGAGKAVRLLNEHGFKVVVITNQSGVGRGLFSEETLGEIHRELSRRLRAAGAVIDAFYFCPHHPTEAREEYRRVCDCRKPASGMILRAATDLGIDLTRSYCVGDRMADLECGRRMGTKGVLVRTGYGREEISRVGKDPALRPSALAADLREAAEWILKDGRRS